MSYFKDFPQFLYDFMYDDRIRTTVVRDITRNIRIKKEIIQNVTLYDEYDIVDGETPEILAERFYGSPNYHWIIMIANGKYDWRSDFPLKEEVLQRHIKTTYNPKLTSNDWYWNTGTDGRIYLYMKVTSGQNVPFDAAYLTAPVTVTIVDDDRSFVHVINFPYDGELGLDEQTQYFYFPVTDVVQTEWLLSHGTDDSTAESGVGNSTLFIETDGRENNPIHYTSMLGNVVGPETPGAIPVTGDYIHRQQNDMKRRIRLISPQLLEILIKNYEELLK